MFVIFSVFYILIAAAMIVLILLQNGAGADAGSGFGSGASATVFGARGSATFLTRATGVLATLFFLLSLGRGLYLHANGQVVIGGCGACCTSQFRGSLGCSVYPARDSGKSGQSGRSADSQRSCKRFNEKALSNTPAQVAELVDALP
jgi:protein translocase SecG subunit